MGAHQTHTYWASIGGNGPDGQPLPDWPDFQRALVQTLEYIGADILATVDGASSWQGVPEQTRLVLFTIRADRVEVLREDLAILARAYDQEAIGLVGGPGTDTLVSATELTPW